jgi:hypothetical protein
MSVDDEQPQKGPGRPKKRDGGDTEDAQGEEKRTLSGPEALALAFEMRQKLVTLID